MWGIKKIYEKRMDDMLFGNGYENEEDRMWKMDEERRSEIGSFEDWEGKEEIS